MEFWACQGMIDRGFGHVRAGGGGVGVSGMGERLVSFDVMVVFI